MVPAGAHDRPRLGISKQDALKVFHGAAALLGPGHPPSVRKMVPSKPTAVPVFASVNNTPQRLRVVPLFCAVHVAPPAILRTTDGGTTCWISYVPDHRLAELRSFVLLSVTGPLLMGALWAQPGAFRRNTDPRAGRINGISSGPVFLEGSNAAGSSSARGAIVWVACVEALERIAPEEGLIFSRYDYRRTLRKAAAQVIGEERARYLTLRDLRHAALTDLAECTQSVGAVAAIAGHRDLQTTSRYFNARKRAATAALRARTAADRRLATVTGTVTVPDPQSGTTTLPQKIGDGRVAQLDRALPSGGRSRGFESLRVRNDFKGLAVS